MHRKSSYRMPMIPEKTVDLKEVQKNFLSCFILELASAKHNRISVKYTEKVVVECQWSQKKTVQLKEVQ